MAAVKRDPSSRLRRNLSAMTRTRSWSLFLGLAVLAQPFSLQAAEPFRFPTGKAGDKAELKYINDLPVLVASGTPEEIGSSVGALGLKSAAKALDYPRELLKFHNAEMLWNLFLTTGNAMVRHFPPEYSKELDALVKGARADRDKVVAGNTLFDLKKAFACSALMIEAERSATGAPLLGRNLDYPSLGYIQHYSLVTVYRPAGKHAFASVGFPGLLGCLSGMNDAGLCLAILEVFDLKQGEKAFDPEGIPYALCNRKILEECTTIDEAFTLLSGLRRTTTINLVLADRKGVAVFEVTPGRVVRRNGEKGTCSCTNHYCTAPLKPADPLDVNDSYGRFASLNKVRAASRKLTPDDVRKQLDKVNLGTLTLQTMVFEPATLKLHLATGDVPASSLPLRTLDLAPLLKGETKFMGE
jgi:predicted choloylglycine hydrolase